MDGWNRQIDRWMDGWMDVIEGMDRWMGGWMGQMGGWNGWMGQMGGWNEWMNLWMDGQMDKLMDGWMDGWMDGLPSVQQLKSTIADDWSYWIATAQTPIPRAPSLTKKQTR